MDYNITVVSSSLKMYPTEYLSNSSSIPSFSSIVELNMQYEFQENKLAIRDADTYFKQKI